VWVSSGLAGALRDSLRLGDVIAPRAVLSKTGAGSPTNRLEVDKELHQLALNTGANPAECLLTACRVLTLAVEKKAQGSVAELVDMESFDVIREARKRGSRGVIIRAISDSADEDLPIDFNATLSRSRQVSLPRVLLRLAKNPWAMHRLIRFGKQSRKAAESLALFLDSYVLRIAQLPSLQEHEKVAV
jgi:purine-nucleoside phosphorylase